MSEDDQKNEPIEAPAPQPPEITETEIKAWALENKPQARALGLWIVLNASTPDILPGTGEFEDRVVQWARIHPMAARLLLMRLMTEIGTS